MKPTTSSTMPRGSPAPASPALPLGDVTNLLLPGTPIPIKSRRTGGRPAPSAFSSICSATPAPRMSSSATVSFTLAPKPSSAAAPSVRPAPAPSDASVLEGERSAAASPAISTVRTPDARRTTRNPTGTNSKGKEPAAAFATGTSSCPPLGKATSRNTESHVALRKTTMAQDTQCKAPCHEARMVTPPPKPSSTASLEVEEERSVVESESISTGTTNRGNELVAAAGTASCPLGKGTSRRSSMVQNTQQISSSAPCHGDCIMEKSNNDIVEVTNLSGRSGNKTFELEPVLVITRQPPAFPLTTVLKVSNHGVPTAVKFEAAECLVPPPAEALCWGAANGFIALRDAANSSISLHCPTCGFTNPMPDLPPNMEPKGIYICGVSFVLAIMTDVSEEDNEDPNRDNLVIHIDESLLFIRQLHVDCEEDDCIEVDSGSEDSDITLEWKWGIYPRAEGFCPMRSVNFIRNVTFAAVTGTNVLILDESKRLMGNPFLEIELEKCLQLDNHMVTWMRNGQHIFSCGHRDYICVMIRSVLDQNFVGVRCLEINKDDETGFSLTQVKDIGQYSVFAGSNQSLVLPAIGGLAGRSPNTVYIEDNDGISRNSRVLGINIKTEELQVIPLPEDLMFARHDFTASAWTAHLKEISSSVTVTLTSVVCSW